MLTGVGTRVRWRIVARELGEIILQTRLAGQHLFGQQVLLIQKENHRYRTQPPGKLYELAERNFIKATTSTVPIVPNAFEKL